MRTLPGGLGKATATKWAYGLLYRVGLRPWEHYGTVARSSIDAVLDREGAGRPDPPGRVLDLGCGRGQYAPLLIARGWDYVGVDNVPEAIAAAERRQIDGARFLVADAANLPTDELGSFDLFLDVGCFAHLDGHARVAVGRALTAMANPGATVLMLQFGLAGVGAVVGGVSREQVEAAFPEWRVLSDEPAETRGLGWPLTRTDPRWFRLGL